MDLLIILILVLLILGVLPSWPYSNNWGYGPMGILLVVLVVVLLMRIL